MDDDVTERTLIIKSANKKKKKESPLFVGSIKKIKIKKLVVGSDIYINKTFFFPKPNVDLFFALRPCLVATTILR
jgi:hypothetical protein